MLCLSVSELGWRATLLHPDEATPQSGAEQGVDGDVSVTPVEMLHRAVRAISAAQRERIGSVRLLIEDPATCLADNRSTRIKSTDPVIIRQAGAQELGAKGALYAFQPFGRSSEHEVERGAYAFLSTDRAQDYLGALDSLAVKLVEIVPAGLLRLAGGEGPPFAALDVRASSSTLLLADAETGVVVCREIACGTRSFVSAVAEATSVSAKEAAEGLRRRACFRADSAAKGASVPPTATERALTPILASLRAELLASVEYFLFQRLAGAPERLAVTGEAGHVRGLAEWVGGVMELPPEAGEDLHECFAGARFGGRVNLLESAPKGLLKIGKAEYRFAEGRFRPDQALPVRAARPAGGGLNASITAASFQHAFASAGSARVAMPVVAFAGLGIALWATVAGADAELDRANGVLSASLAQDAILHSALARRLHPAPDDSGKATLYWTEKLVAIAEAVPDGLRLTKVSAAADRKQATRDDQLILEGETAAEGDSLARITALIERLSGDGAFMRDVASITLDGTSAVEGAAHDLVRFSVTVTLGAPVGSRVDTSPGQGKG